MGSVFGEVFKIMSFGESHGTAIGCVIDGCPAGLSLDRTDFAADMGRRRPGQGAFDSKRCEADKVEILSGVFNGITLGTPIAIVIRNGGQNSADYDELARLFRPGHADYTYYAKYGIRDHRGGGRASGRETAARVAAGVVAKKILTQLDVAVAARVYSIGGIEAGSDFKQNPQIAALIAECSAKGNSVGSMVECEIIGLKSGIGAPVFDKLSAALAEAFHSIGGVKAVEFGAGFASAIMCGSDCNDPFVAEDGKIAKATNNAGGILGGISDGGKIRALIAFKPPPSIAVPQSTVDVDGRPAVVSVKGRHDPVIGPRACVVVEAMAAVTLVDHIFRSFTDRMDDVKRAYLLT